MTKPVRLRLSRAKGFDLQAHSLAVNGLPAVVVARPGIWGNPFVVGKPSGCDFKDDGDKTPMIAAVPQSKAIEFYRIMAQGFLSPEMHPHGHAHMERWRRKVIGMSIAEAARCYLRGKNLACWCALPKHGEPDICHASVLLRLSNIQAVDS